MNPWISLLAWYGMWSDGTRRFPDVPVNHWIYEGLGEAKREGLLVGYPDGLVYRAAPETKHSVAVRVDYMIRSYRRLGGHLLKERAEISSLRTPISGDRWVAYRTDFEIYQTMHRLVPVLQRACAEFLPQMLELKKLSRDEKDDWMAFTRVSDRVRSFGLAVPGQTFTQFRDVPTQHWASKAVGDLRALGLLDGYPDGRFGG